MSVVAGKQRRLCRRLVATTAVMATAGALLPLLATAVAAAVSQLQRDFDPQQQRDNAATPGQQELVERRHMPEPDDSLLHMPVLPPTNAWLYIGIADGMPSALVQTCRCS